MQIVIANKRETSSSHDCKLVQLSTKIKHKHGQNKRNLEALPLRGFLI